MSSLSLSPGMRGNGEAEIDRLPTDVLAHVLSLLSSFKDLAHASGVCRKWEKSVKQSLGGREKLSFAGWKMDDLCTTRIVHLAYNLKELDISKSCWGCQITDTGLFQISTAMCVKNLTSISLWGNTGISDEGVVQLISRTSSLQHLNIGGTFITDTSLFAISESCRHLKTIVLWSCRHVTEIGLLAIAQKCRKLESMDVWGTRVPTSCFLSVVSINPAIHIKPKGVLIERVPVEPVF